MLGTILIAAGVLAAGFLIYLAMKKAFKVGIFIFCIGIAFVALKYWLGVI